VGNPGTPVSATSSRDLTLEIERLQSANRAAPDPAVERRLVELRLAAAAAAPTVPAEPPSWWTDVDDPFPGLVDAVPEVGRRELDARLLRGAIAFHGCLMVRGLFSRALVDELARDIDRALVAFDRYFEGAPHADDNAWFQPFDPADSNDHRFGRILGRRAAGAVNASDSPRTFFHLVEAFSEAGVPELLTEYLGGHPCVAIDKCTVRRVQTEAATGWHQDSYRFPQGAPVCDVWVAFSECGGRAPGLEIIPRRVEESAELDPTADIPWVIANDVIDGIAGDRPKLSPQFGPGDAIVFDEMLLHRTGTFPGMSEPRYGADAWFFPAGTYLTEKVPSLLF
jgi:hypothetical protein